MEKEKKTGQYPLADGAGYRIRDLPADLRPRELVEAVGVENAQVDVLLALILRVGTRGRNARDLALDLLRKYHDLTGMARAPVEELARAAPGMGRVKAQILKAAFELARRMAVKTEGDLPVIRKPEDAAGVLRETARPLDREVFWILVLNAKNRLKVNPVQITSGLLDSSLVHPREVFKPAVGNGAAAIILAHNHPSGDPTPSTEDIRITAQLIQAGRSLDIAVLDHVIMGRAEDGRDKDFISMRESGSVSFAR